MNIIEARVELEFPVELESALLESTFRPGRVYQGPDVIDLGNFQPEAEGLIEHTLSHPFNHEAGKMVYATNDREMWVDDLVVGELDEVVIPFDPHEYEVDVNEEGRIVQSKYKSMVMHSHRLDLPLSFHDIQSLLYEDRDVGRNTAALAITPVRKIMAFRGEQTPHLGRFKARKVVNALYDEKNARLKDEEDFTTTEDENDTVEARIGWGMFYRLAERYDLQLFSGTVWDKYMCRIKTEDTEL